MAPTAFLFTYMSAILPLFEKRPISGVQFRSCDSGDYCPPNNKLYPGCLIEDRGAPPYVGRGSRSFNQDSGLYRHATFDVSDQYCVQQTKSCGDFLIDGKYSDPSANVTWSSEHIYNESLTGYRLFTNEAYVSSVHQAWYSARNDTNPYIQVVFGHKRNVTGVVIAERGRVDYNKYIYYHWLKEYSLQFTENGSVWYDYMDVSGIPVLIPGNDGSYNPKVHYLPDTLQLLGVRILPKKKNLYKALRFDIIGC